MAKDAPASRPWYRWNPRDFNSDPAVVLMDREQRWRYRDALDFCWDAGAGGVATEDQWRRWLGYRPSQWQDHREAFALAFRIEGDNWTQNRLAEEWAHATGKSLQARAAGVARQANTAPADGQRTLSGRSADAIEILDTPEILREEPLNQSTPLARSLNGSGPPIEFLTFPCCGTGPKAYAVTEEGIERLAELFPAVDIRQSLRSMLAWVLSNPTRRKTARGMPKFITGWLQRDQDSGRSRKPATQDNQAALQAFIAGEGR